MNTVSQIFPRTGRISGLEVGDGANRIFQQLTEKTTKKKLAFYEAVVFINFDNIRAIRTSYCYFTSKPKPFL